MAYEQIVTVSGSASSGQIPQSNGNGSYSWVTPAPGVSPSSATPAMDGTAAAGSSADYARGDHVHPTDTSRAASSHAHGNITNAGAITATGVALASGDTLAFVDSSDSSKIKKTSVSFDGSTTTQALTKKGTFETFLTSHQDISALAPKASPALTGTPTAPTASAGTSTTQIATTAFVQNALSAFSAMIKVNVGTVSSLPVTVNSAMITSDMELIRAELGTPSAQASDWTVTTANGSVTISGTVSADESTSLILYLSTVQSTS